MEDSYCHMQKILELNLTFQASPVKVISAGEINYCHRFNIYLENGRKAVIEHDHPSRWVQVSGDKLHDEILREIADAIEKSPR